MGAAGRPSVSVVVPTRDRPFALEACLAALDAQTIAEQLEVVVVDDGSVDRHTVAAVVARHASARLIRKNRQGPAAARNAGARAARADVLCFTDDDCVPEAEWAARLLEAIARGADAVAGKTLTTPGPLAEASEVISGAPAAAEPFAPSNNLACTRSVFEVVPFDESYPHAAAEDREWCTRLVASRRTLEIEPSARLLHRPSLTLVTFLRRQMRYGRGAYRYRHNVRRPLEPTGFYVALVQRGFRRGLIVGVLVVLSQLATALGWARGWLDLRQELTVSDARAGERPEGGA
jgi:glycosyltransferase involved in cell wall biosynthesis